MAVEVIGMTGETNGFGDSKEAFLTAHVSNTNVLLNLSEGKKKNDPRAPYDPKHPDNQWPVMVYHPARGEKVVGVSLGGLTGNVRKQAEADNGKALEQAKKDGYRQEPYPKPQVVVLDPAQEKAALLARNQELEGKIVAQQDQINRLAAAVEKLLEGKV